ncbi:peptidoglycan/LPS O-acetylase OafA/YrhL [Burkholderia sp. OAS925]
MLRTAATHVDRIRLPGHSRGTGPSITDLNGSRTRTAFALEDTHMNKRIAGFDGLRAIAVLMVFLQHRLFGDIGEIGHLGVWIFFALSGFLIIGILSAQRLRIEENGSGFVVELKRFLFRRTLRIFPTYYLMLTVMCVLMLFGIASPELASGMPFHFAYLSNFWIGSVLHYWPGRYSHLWSLAIEEQFYVVVAPLLLLLAARRHFVACVMIAATGLVALFAMRAGHWQEITIYTHPLSNFWLLALGGMGGLMVAGNAAGVRAWLGHGATLFALSVCLVGFCASEPVWSELHDPLLFTVVNAVYGTGMHRGARVFDCMLPQCGRRGSAGSALARGARADQLRLLSVSQPDSRPDPQPSRAGVVRRCGAAVGAYAGNCGVVRHLARARAAVMAADRGADSSIEDAGGFGG